MLLLALGHNPCAALTCAYPCSKALKLKSSHVEGPRAMGRKKQHRTVYVEKQGYCTAVLCLWQEGRKKGGRRAEEGGKKGAKNT